MITTSSLPPPIELGFDPRFLYGFLKYKKYRLEEEIIPLSIRKIRDIDTGKRREFDKLLKEFKEEYERKKAEEAEYEAKIEEALQKRPHISASSGVRRFKKMDPNDRSDKQTNPLN